MAKAGSAFEEKVELLYRQAGAIDVRRNVNILGNEIDVVAIMPNIDGTTTKCIISCKDLGKPAGIELVREWYRVLLPVRNAGEADLGVIVSSRGFTQDAHAAAPAMGIKLVTAEALTWAGCDFRPYLKTLLGEFGSETVFASGRYITVGLRYDKAKDPMPAEDLINGFLSDPKPRLLTILGDYGAGKTTLAKKLFQDHASRFISGASSARVPIFVNLKNFPQYLNLPSFLTHMLVNEYGARCNSYATLKALSDEGKVLFIFDAFDEMATRTDRALTLRNFQALSTLFSPKSKTILTCRTHYFRDQSHAHEVHGTTELAEYAKGTQYRFAMLSGLGPEQIEAYVKNVCGDTWKEYYDVIMSTYNLPALAEKPILLQMITEVVPTLVQAGKKVDSTVLYAAYTELWLRRDDWRVTLPRQERLRFTLAFAEEMYRRGVSSFTWQDLEAAVTSHWPSAARRDLEHYQNDIRTCSFIKRNTETDEYSFIHQSFTEYFVATRIYEMIVDGDLSLMTGRVHSPEIIDFLSGHMLTEQVLKHIKESLGPAITKSAFAKNVLATAAKWGIPISGVEIRQVDFDAVSFTKLFASDTKITQCKAKQLSIGASVFDRVEWANSDVAKFRATECELRGSDLIGLSLANAQLDNCIFDGVKFDRCDITGIWQACRISKCTFSGTTFKGAINRGTITGCDFSAAIMRRTYFVCVQMADNWWSAQSLDGCVFTDVEFLDGGESLIRSVRRLQSIAWTEAPQLATPRQLDTRIAGQLRDLGFKIM